MGVQKLGTADFGVLTKAGATSVQLVWARNAPDARATITRVTLERGASQELHAHPVSEQIWVVESGTATMLLPGEAAIALSAGDVVRTPAGHAHGLRNDGSQPFVYLTVTTPPQDFSSVYGRG